MKFRFFSDVHNELRRRDKIPPFRVKGMAADRKHVLILAGDVDKAKHVKKYIESYADRFLAVIFVPGNHEYWDNNIDAADEKMQSDLPNVHFLNRQSIKIQDTWIIGCTLWTDMKEGDPLTDIMVGADFADYKNIKYGKNHRKLRPVHTKFIHNEDIRFIQSEMSRIDSEDPAAKILVVTHHAPSHQSRNGTIERTSNVDFVMDYCYYSNLDWLVEHADFWIHGHTHYNVEYKIENCTVKTNQLGYLLKNEDRRQPDFDEICLHEI